MFKERIRLVRHLTNDHDPATSPPTRYQNRIINCLFREAGALAAGSWLLGSESMLTFDNPMERSAEIMREMLFGNPSYASLSTTIESYDSLLCWLIDDDGMKVAFQSDIAAMGGRRVEGMNLHHTDRFLQLLLCACLDLETKARARSVQRFLSRAFAARGGGSSFDSAGKEHHSEAAALMCRTVRECH